MKHKTHSPPKFLFLNTGLEFQISVLQSNFALVINVIDLVIGIVPVTFRWRKYSPNKIGNFRTPKVCADPWRIGPKSPPSAETITFSSSLVFVMMFTTPAYAFCPKLRADLTFYNFNSFYWSQIERRFIELCPVCEWLIRIPFTKIRTCSKPLPRKEILPNAVTASSADIKTSETEPKLLQHFWLASL